MSGESKTLLAMTPDIHLSGHTQNQIRSVAYISQLPSLPIWILSATTILLPLINKAFAPGDKSLMTPRACHGSMLPLGKIMRVTLTPSPP